VSARTGFVTHEDCALHYAGPGHPERPERVQALCALLRECGLMDTLDARAARPATLAELALVHPEPHALAIERACSAGRALLDDGDTYVCPDSWRAALLSAGAALQAAELVHTRRWNNAFVATRPPGHHASEAQVMGFCLFNNVALAARYLRRCGVERVAIVDWDVHHGNGTQRIFERDPHVFYASLHQYPHYPGTGAARERGLGAGEGATLNLPQPAGSGDSEWLRAFESQLAPALDSFAPQFVLVSAGFDAHADDPLSDTRLTEPAYARMTEVLLDIARRHAGGRLVAVLEGGYDLGALSRSARAHVETLLCA
jgi:acetoin utilization deacetylase AcuC-like enzyme